MITVPECAHFLWNTRGQYSQAITSPALWHSQQYQSCVLAESFFLWFSISSCHKEKDKTIRHSKFIYLKVGNELNRKRNLRMRRKWKIRGQKILSKRTPVLEGLLQGNTFSWLLLQGLQEYCLIRMILSLFWPLSQRSLLKIIHLPNLTLSVWVSALWIANFNLIQLIHCPCRLISARQRNLSYDSLEWHILKKIKNY